MECFLKKEIFCRKKYLSINKQKKTQNMKEKIKLSIYKKQTNKKSFFGIPFVIQQSDQ